MSISKRIYTQRMLGRKKNKKPKREQVYFATMSDRQFKRLLGEEAPPRTEWRRFDLMTVGELKEILRTEPDLTPIQRQWISNLIDLRHEIQIWPVQKPAA